MTPFIIIFEPAAELAITPSRYPEWARLADARGYIIWNREGMVRTVPHEVIENAMHIYAQYNMMIAAGRLVNMPPSASKILWEQARAVNH